MIVQYIEGFTSVLGAPKDWGPTKNGECLGLPVRTEAYGDSVSMTSAWKPSPDELAALLAGASINLRVIGGHPPVSLFVEGIGEDLQVAEPSAEDQRQMLMAKVLRLCGMQFEAYADLHAAKQTVDGDAKAATNRQYAKLCADVLEGLPMPATSGEGYSEFFYDLANMMDMGPQPKSPAEVWQNEMRPKLLEALARTGDAETAELADLRAKLEAAEKAARNANADADMYANAWQRELGGAFVNKRHHIDAMVGTTKRIVKAYKDAVARGLIDDVFRSPRPPGARVMSADDIGMGKKDLAARFAVAKIAADLRGRKFLGYLFDEHPDNVGAYGHIDCAFDLALQREIFTTWEGLIREAMEPAL